MLSTDKILHYVKVNLAFPWQFLELTDDDIMDYITSFTLPEFSHYFPQKQKIPIDILTNPTVPNIKNEYYIQEPDGIEILNVVNVYYPASLYYFHGHPPYGPMSTGDMREWAIQTSMAMDVMQHSTWNYTSEFMHPNILRISPALPITEGFLTIEYERMQPSDFSGIPNELQIIFCELALADIQIYLGRVRKRYGDNLTTPFGNIPVSSEIFDEGRDKKREILDLLTSGSRPNVVMQIG